MVLSEMGWGENAWNDAENDNKLPFIHEIMFAYMATKLQSRVDGRKFFPNVRTYYVIYIQTSETSQGTFKENYLQNHQFKVWWVAVIDIYGRGVQKKRPEHKQSGFIGLSLLW